MQALPAAAIAAVALLVVSSFAALQTTNPANPKPADISTDRLASLESAITPLARSIGAVQDVRAEATWLSSLSAPQLSELRSQNASRPVSPKVLADLGLTPDSLNLYCFGSSIVAGAAVGGIAGAGVGAIIGGVAGATVGYFGCQNSQAGGNVGQAYAAWATAIVAELGNEANLTATSYSNLISALNFSLVGWDRAADNAALLQLNKTSFSIPVDLAQSTVAQQLDQVLSTYDQETQRETMSVVTWSDAEGGATGDAYFSVIPEIGIAGSAQAPSPGTPSSAGFGADSGATVNAVVYIPNGATLFAGGNTSATLTNVATGQVLTLAFGSACGQASLTFGGPTGAYFDTSGSDIEISNGGLVPTASSGSGASITSADASFINVGGCSGALTNTGTFSLGHKSGTNYVQDTPGVAVTGGAVGGNLAKWLGSLEYQAAINAETYWSFLRSLGFTSISQIPPSCIVPAPYMTFPSALNQTNLTISQATSLYLAALQAMGNFYNVTLNATSFCGVTAHKQFSIGSSIWGNLFVNATGFVYLNNGTSAIDIRGHALATEKYGNRSTWAVGNDTSACGGALRSRCTGPQQLLLMPTIRTATVPVGHNWAVPSQNPIEVYVVQSGQMLRLTGNGSNPGGTILSVAGSLTTDAAPPPGDAVYLTSCIVNGQATGNCTVTVQTVNTTVTSITCPGGGSSCQPAPPGGFFSGIPNPFTWFANWLANLFGGGPLGQLLANIVEVVIVVGVILVLVYVLVVEVQGWGRRKSSGSNGPAARQ